MKIAQLNVGGFDNNFTYIIIGENNECILIDPTGSKNVINAYLKQHSLKPILQLITHAHPDHIENIDYYAEEKKVPLKSFNELKKEKIIKICGIKIEVLFTPGHTEDSVCFKIENNIFTGDTLFVKGVGTTAYGGDDAVLANSLQSLFKLDQEIILWPGHDYGGVTSTLREALANSHIAPSKETLNLIHKKVADYNKGQKLPFDGPTN
jgi:glyoxylase-like metal-dependent hydrolase (beta-lactamase superfamily II)